DRREGQEPLNPEHQMCQARISVASLRLQPASSRACASCQLVLLARSVSACLRVKPSLLSMHSSQASSTPSSGCSSASSSVAIPPILLIVPPPIVQFLCAGSNPLIG